MGLGSASPRLPPASSTSAAPGPPSTTGSSPATRGAPSSCASRTPTPSATARSGSTASSRRWRGWAWTPDEGPFRQSERTGLYQGAIDRLWEAGALYACECTRDEIDARTKGNATPGYDGFCRDRGLTRPGRALRFRVPEEGTVVVHDLIRGDVVFANEAIEDFVVVKSSGAPLFVLANVVDDIDMHITHVIRGEDLLPSTPKALLLWSALEGDSATLPAFAHLPLLVNERRQKLSKRRDDVARSSPTASAGYLAAGHAQLPGAARVERSPGPRDPLRRGDGGGRSSCPR